MTPEEEGGLLSQVREGWGDRAWSIDYDLVDGVVDVYLEGEVRVFRSLEDAVSASKCRCKWLKTCAFCGKGTMP